MGQGRRPRLIALALLAAPLLGACGGDDGGAPGPPDGYEAVFSDDFSADLAAWDIMGGGCEIDATVGRPAPSLAGSCDALSLPIVPFAHQRAIGAIDFRPAAGDRTMLFFSITSSDSSTAQPSIDLMIDADSSLLEVDCPEANTVIVAGFKATDFHHVDLRVDDGGTSVSIDAVERCHPSGPAALSGGYRLDVGASGLAGLRLDNAKLYRGP